MARVCLLISKTPASEESAERIFGVSERAVEKGMEVAIYLIGNGVLCARSNQSGLTGKKVRKALENSVAIKASEKDLQARAITEADVETGIQVLDDLEGSFVEDVMEKADRVISW